MEETETVEEKKTNDDEKLILKRCLRYLKESSVAEKRWRPRSQKSLEYYYNKQWASSDKSVVEDRGQKAITINRSRITINMMLGLLAAQPLDPHAKPVGANDDSIADLGTAVVKHIWNKNDGVTIQLLTYFYQIVYGFAGVYTGFYVRDRNRKSEPVQAIVPDPRELTRDNLCRQDDLSDCRWVEWKRKLPLETAQQLWKKHSKILAKMVGKDGEQSASNETYTGPIDGSVPGPGHWDSLESWNLTQDVDKVAEMVTVHEIWERRWEKGNLVFCIDGNVDEFDDDDASSILMDPSVQRVEQDIDIPRIYYHVVCGDKLLESEKSPYNHGEFPFVWISNDIDHNGDPISEMEYLKDLQDEINHRRSKELWELSASPLVIDQPMLDRMGFSIEDAKEHAKNPGAVWIGNPGEINHLQKQVIPGQNYQLMQDTKSEMQAVSGANDDLMGYRSSSRSGVAKDIVRDQGMTLQKPREVRFKGFMRRIVEQMMALVQQAWTEEKVVRLRDDVGQDKLIQVNRREIDPVTGMSRVMNDINQARFEYEIDFDQWTSTSREKLGNVLKDLASQEPDPIARRALLIAAIKTLPIPDKSVIINAYNEAAQASMPSPSSGMGMAPGEQPVSQLAPNMVM